MNPDEFTPRRMLTRLAWEVAAVLNAVEDTDERDLLREHFEGIVQAELSDAAGNRLMADSLLASTLGLVDREGRLDNVHAIREDALEQRRLK